MYAEIRSRDLYSESKGKTSRVIGAHPKFNLKESSPNHHPRRHPWYLEIKARYDDDRTTDQGAFNNEYRGVGRDLLVELTPSDVAKLVSFILSNEIVGFRADAAKEKQEL